MVALYTAGVDSGTYTVDVVVLRDEPLSVVYEEAIPRSRVVENPETVVELLESLHEKYGLAGVVVSSGYGVELKPTREASTAEIWAATFIHHWDERAGLRILGLRRVMELSRRLSVEAWFTPGVVQLHTVPEWRKINRIDMGTSDKVYSVAAALWDAVENHGSRPREVDMIVLEVGYAYTAAIAVKKGEIVDGVGGTMGQPGYMGHGAWDGEVAYLAAWLTPGFSKNQLFRGGVAELLGEHYPPPPPEEVAGRAEEGDERARIVLEALAENAAKDAATLLPVVVPEAVYVTGRWSRIPAFMKLLEQKLEPLKRLGAETRTLPLPAKAKEAAFGAALIANGLAGGKYRWIVETLRLKDSSGTPLDHVAV